MRPLAHLQPARARMAAPSVLQRDEAQIFGELCQRFAERVVGNTREGSRAGRRAGRHLRNAAPRVSTPLAHTVPVHRYRFSQDVPEGFFGHVQRCRRVSRSGHHRVMGPCSVCSTIWFRPSLPARRFVLYPRAHVLRRLVAIHFGTRLPVVVCVVIQHLEARSDRAEQSASASLLELFAKRYRD